MRKNFNSIGLRVKLFIAMGLLPVMALCQMVDVSNLMNLTTDHTGGFLGAGVSFADFNGDKIDDLSFANHLGDVRFYEGTGEEDGFSEVNLGLSDYPFEAKMILWSDIDNDGDQDLFITYRLVPNRMYRNDGGVFEDVSSTCGINQGARKSYGACFGDYNRDGFLDLFVANYTSSFDEYAFNELYLNQGDGTFEDVTESSGMFLNTGIQSFQGQWVDFNGDGLLDLHVIRDRTIYSNHYYEQQLEMAITPFLEKSADVGLDVSINCMSSSVADYDNDLDMDIYLSAFPDDQNWLLVNNNYAFSEVNEETQDIPMDDMQVDAICWAANWFDVDNNGHEDLHVAGGFSEYTNYPSILDAYDKPDKLFFNENGSFTESENALFQTESVLSFSTATGDYNRDGFPDLVSNRVGPYAQLLRSEPNGNHWVKFWLEGTASNRDAIGATIEVWVDGGVQSRMTFAGENYMGQNSHWEHFGLGTATAVDSVVVNWPIGSPDVHQNIGIDQHWVLVQGASPSSLWSGEGCEEECYGCTYPEACNFNEEATIEDGTCSFSCWSNSEACGQGTVWDEGSSSCIPDPNLCVGDLDYDNSITVNDLLILLNVMFGDCPE